MFNYFRVLELILHRISSHRYDKQIAENGASDPALLSMLATMEKLADAMTAYSQTEAAQKALNKITKD